MSGRDEPSETRKRRRRRSLRVPVDEVPRPTAARGADDPPFDPPFDGGRTLEIPAYTDEVEEGRVTLDEPIDALDPALLGAMRAPGPEDPLEEAPTVVREAPSESEEEPAPVSPLASVEVQLDEQGPNTLVGDDAPESEPEEDAEHELAGDADDRPTPARLSAPAPADAAPDEGEAEAPAAAAIAPVVQVIVQRVVAVASASTTPPPPEEEDEPHASFDFDEPDITVDDTDADDDDGADDLEELDVDVDGDEADARARAEEISEQEALDLLEEEDEAVELSRAKRPSKPPVPPQPPPPKAPKGANAPPPPPETAAARPAAPAKPAEAPVLESAPSASAAPRRRKAKKKWFEELFNDDYLRTVPIPHPRTILRQCDFIEQRLGLARGATILDVGCGLGLHAVELTRRGYLVVGLDLSLPMLSRAADEAQDHGLKINFLHADMREMNFDGAFDAVLCWGTTFGYFDDETNRKVIERLYRALKPRGLLLLDVVNRDYVIEGQPNLVWFEGDGCVVMEETKMNYISSRLEVKRTVILDNGRQRDAVYSIRLFSLHELGLILHQQGFRVVELSGREAHPGVFFGPASPKLIILAERRPQGPPGGPSSASSGSEPAPPPDSLEDIALPAEAPPDRARATSAEEPAPPSGDVDEAMSAALAQSGELELEPPSAELLLEEELESEEALLEESDLDEDAAGDGEPRDESE